MQPVYMTNDEAAAYMCLRPQTLRVWRIRGCGPPYRRAGSKPVYARADLDAWLASRTYTSTAAESAAAQAPPRK